MSADDNLTFLRESYAAYESADLDWILASYSPDVVFHVSGRHPLSGHYVGHDEVLGYLLRVSELSGGNGGFVVKRQFADDEYAIAWVEGTAFNGADPFIREVVHMARIVDGQLLEFWDNPLDQHAEDEFWTTVVSQHGKT